MRVSASVLRERSEATTNAHDDTASDKPTNGNLTCFDGASVTLIHVARWTIDKPHHSNCRNTQPDGKSDTSSDCELF